MVKCQRQRRKQHPTCQEDPASCRLCNLRTCRSCTQEQHGELASVHRCNSLWCLCREAYKDRCWQCSVLCHLLGNPRPLYPSLRKWNTILIIESILYLLRCSDQHIIRTSQSRSFHDLDCRFSIVLLPDLQGSCCSCLELFLQ